ncbi:pseudaminic acid synthase [Candidatus Pelagibacter bacterium]|nr:pseudaminic acid synthase [Candidatus Pelagibacter bacterium]MDA8841778.1 pseudaminic acid synthase [Candidatus Pelagibacter bacterium]
MLPFKIKHDTIGINKPCYIVAELSANHAGSLNKLKKLIIESKKAGANAVKIQAYEADKITINSNNKEFLINKKNPWKSYKNLFNLYKKAQTPRKWYKEIFLFAKKNKITLFASVFDNSTVDVLEKLNCPAYKIASAEITDIPLIERVAKTKKPIIISNGLADLKDLKLAIKTIKKYNKKIIVLKCTASYPAPVKTLNLKMIKFLRKKLKVLTGFSDHTLGITSPVFAASQGAVMIEKHIKINNEKKSVDSFFSIDTKEMSEMIKNIRNNENSYGKIDYAIPQSAIPNLKSRKSLFVIKDIEKGEFFTEKNIRSIRPSGGLHPKYFKKILGKKSKVNLKFGTALKSKHF